MSFSLKMTCISSYVRTCKSIISDKMVLYWLNSSLRRYNMKILFVFIILSLSAHASISDFESHFFINGKKTQGMKHIMIMPNIPTLIEVFFTNPKTGDVYKDFKVMHGKYMHMVIANKDLSVFKHVHPYFDPITGRFALTVNMPYADPDNQDAAATLTSPGMYMVMADVIIAGVGMRMDHAMVMVKGQTTNTSLELDPENNDTITKYFFRDNEPIPLYKAVFSKRLISGCSGNIVHFEIEMYQNISGHYEPLLDFEPWLSEAAHSVWLSENYMSHMHHKMPFAHMHSPMVMDDDDDDTNDRVYDHILRFNFHDQSVMIPGTQKMWIQFKHMGKVIKAPFIFNYVPSKPQGC